MPSLFSKDEDLAKSAPVMGYEILKMLERAEGKRISIFEVAASLRKNHKFTARALYYGMLFLYSLDIIDFSEPYLVLK